MRSVIVGFQYGIVHQHVRPLGAEFICHGAWHIGHIHGNTLPEMPEDVLHENVTSLHNTELSFSCRPAMTRTLPHDVPAGLATLWKVCDRMITRC